MLVSCFFLLSLIRACAVGTTTRICCRQTGILVPSATRLNLTKKRRALGTRMANGLSQTSRSLSLTKRIAASGNEIGSLHASVCYSACAKVLCFILTNKHGRSTEANVCTVALMSYLVNMSSDVM